MADDPIHNVKVRPTLFDFLSGLEEGDRRNFIMSFSEEQLLEKCASLQEFKMIMDRDPFVPFRDKEVMQSEVGVPVVSTEELQEMFDEIKEFFPESLRPSPGPNKIKIQMEIG